MPTDKKPYLLAVPIKSSYSKCGGRQKRPYNKIVSYRDPGAQGPPRAYPAHALLFRNGVLGVFDERHGNTKLHGSAMILEAGERSPQTRTPAQTNLFCAMPTKRSYFQMWWSTEQSCKTIRFSRDPSAQGSIKDPTWVYPVRPLLCRRGVLGLVARKGKTV